MAILYYFLFSLDSTSSCLLVISHISLPYVGLHRDLEEEKQIAYLQLSTTCPLSPLLAPVPLETWDKELVEALAPVSLGLFLTPGLLLSAAEPAGCCISWLKFSEAA